ncbi:MULTISPECIES: CRISPR-associated protein Csm4 [Mannheimia]|uniref:CRISPR system Cms protein Csm4 n=1 Tax=Mannheimia pernigra TaxID=111844 RepID=A0ABD7A6I4_9PAST|nr:MULTISPECIES: CRISPR-associated protein Csm4 [Mannheimia]QLB41732.1 CRISPR-associated protein Csm4 [Mannheimia pernigra]QTM01035.1 CRISPR-associated protein Csm4 [Mannheimia sp. ZY171111]
MKIYLFTLKTLTAFGTPLVGDSLFGQFCWAVSHRLGEAKLTELLQGYTTGKPFAVISDAFPSGFLPLPVLPSQLWEKGEVAQDRKVLKKKALIAFDTHTQAVNSWQKSAKSDSEVMCKTKHPQPHNTLSRQTMTTGKDGMFAPYAMPQIWYQHDTALDLYIVVDEQRISVDEVTQCLSDMGQFGFGRDASIGLGKFKIESVQAVQFATENANAYLTLANTAPQGVDLDKNDSFYQLHTRFGRHGGLAALGQNPFKKPIILAKCAAIFRPTEWQTRLFLGNGLGNVSYAQPNAVHQGYAPIVPVYLNFNADHSDK